MPQSRRRYYYEHYLPHILWWLSDIILHSGLRQNRLRHFLILQPVQAFLASFDPLVEQVGLEHLIPWGGCGSAAPWGWLGSSSCGKCPIAINAFSSLAWFKFSFLNSLNFLASSLRILSNSSSDILTTCVAITTGWFVHRQRLWLIAQLSALRVDSSNSIKPSKGASES